jgi:hypothetical protein
MSAPLVVGCVWLCVKGCVLVPWGPRCSSFLPLYALCAPFPPPPVTHAPPCDRQASSASSASTGQILVGVGVGVGALAAVAAVVVKLRKSGRARTVVDPAAAEPAAPAAGRSSAGRSTAVFVDGGVVLGGGAAQTV